MARGSDLTLLTRIRNFQEEMEGVELIKEREAYGYHYADLPNILNVVTPILRKHGIWFSHITDYDLQSTMNIVRTKLYNVDNEDDCLISQTLIDRTAKLGGMNTFMVEGSAITYFRRYHIVTLLGLTSDEDTDAGGKRVTKSATSKTAGRSVESTAEPTRPDFTATFTKLCKTKTKDQIEKTFGAYKTQMTDEEIKSVEAVIKESYK